jgi:hypothetical protein
MKKIVLLVALMLLLAAPVAEAAFTQDDVVAKAMKLQELIIAATEKAPEKIQEVAAAMQKEIPELQKATDLEPLIKFYDDMIAKLQK